MPRSDDSDGSSSSDEADRFLPKSKKGWQGDHLELEHQRESFLEHKDKSVAAVDISQFQNHEVGQGYQAKHVVRQRQAPSDANNNQQVTHLTRTLEDPPTSSLRKRKAPDTAACVPDNPRTLLKKYLASPGMVAFRKEMEDILSS